MFNNTTKIGKKAEMIAREYLKSKGYKILDQNWRTRFCEIDIVARKVKTIYFVEVKYRSTINSGDGLDAITAKKLEQMQFAAEMWVNSNKWMGEYQLVAISLSGQPAKVTSFIFI
jgi:uncharacterized protein (TIGR00252 family)